MYTGLGSGVLCSGWGCARVHGYGSRERGQMGNEEMLKLSVPESRGLEGYAQFRLIIAPKSIAGVAGPWEHLAVEVALRSLSV